ncbi:nicotinate phosphoribosyltransferase [Microbulbifer sp. A4B17]|uniref:nicotinate phosphoribosyltransferase n=1 Tax=Microbulbifer sp. A4B17 TaxID=359370 RepID=UPI000D52B3F3|nr:nicotinate phosphoribosyltransferase [Microbulbifer sp. A4B17]AWF79437.1 nicotinate phosphoribosyltransferase [Microbulbifer sp. A4B17]
MNTQSSNTPFQLSGNPILNVDSYKTSHYLQYPPGTSHISSYIECRGGEFSAAMFFGLQAFIKQYLSVPVCTYQVDEAEDILKSHGLPFNRDGWTHIVSSHKGFLPIEITAVEEGQVIPVKNVMAQVVNTCPTCFWLTTYIETALLRSIWYPSTVATQSREIKKIISKYLFETADSQNNLELRLHDFGARGASSLETAMLGGMAHLVNFKGTDTISGILAANKFYSATRPGFSIPAAEHSTIIAWGQENEEEAYLNILNQFSGNKKTVAVVSDSYDLWNAIENIWGKKLKNQIIHSGGTLVIRPDSGDPEKIVVDTVERLMRIFGSEINKKGYRVLPPFIRVIQGDGITRFTIPKILQAMKENKQSTENLTFGMGGGLLQKVDRDLIGFAMKASAICINGTWYDIFKDPRTGPEKKSKGGRLALIRKSDGSFQTLKQSELKQDTSLLKPVYRDGILLKDITFDEVRRNAAI